MIRYLSFRARLILLVLIAVLPALGLILFTAAEERRSASEEAQKNALRLARTASATQNGSIEGARQLLAALAETPEVRDTNLSACNPMFQRLLKQNQTYAGLGAVNLNSDPSAVASQSTGGSI